MRPGFAQARMDSVGWASAHHCHGSDCVGAGTKGGGPGYGATPIAIRHPDECRADQTWGALEFRCRLGLYSTWVPRRIWMLRVRGFKEFGLQQAEKEEHESHIIGTRFAGPSKRIR